MTGHEMTALPPFSNHAAAIVESAKTVAAMAKIFTPVQCKGGSSRVIISAWGQHPSFTALAVAREGGIVNFFQEEVRGRRRAPARAWRAHARRACGARAAPRP